MAYFKAYPLTTPTTVTAKLKMLTEALFNHFISLSRDRSPVFN